MEDFGDLNSILSLPGCDKVDSIACISLSELFGVPTRGLL